MTRFPRSLLSLFICLLFCTVASAQSVITESGGNVGISTTNPQAKLDVNGNALIGTTKANIGASGNGVDFPSIGYNVNYTSTPDTYNFRIGDSATLLRFGNGYTATKRAFEFKAATKGVAGAQISFTDLMTMLYNGNVGIGTTTPTYKLEVAGSVKMSGAGSGIVFPDGSIQTTASATSSGASIINAINDAATTGTINLNRVGSIDSTHLGDGAVTLAKLSAQPTAAGQVLTYDGQGLSWQSQSGPTAFRFTRTTRCGPFDEFSALDHPLLNGKPNAMIFVTALIGINGDRTNTNPNQNLVVTYSGDSDFGTCPAGRWLIRGGDISDNAQFNVMVVGQ
ncbi:MAG TPA: hypothetical protein VJS44_02975 [Pyrinomonadaceae bacterium]|nr:hypothetical protein [Pyrinomonadaceae bacterium]